MTKVQSCDVSTAQCEDGTVKCAKQNKGITKCDKRTVNMMLVLPNVTMEPSNLKKNNNKGTTKCDKKQLHVMLELHNVR